MKPFSAKVNFKDGVVKPYHSKTERKLSHMRNLFYETSIVEKILKEDDRIIYEAYEIRSLGQEGQLSWCTTIIYPGCIGKEYHMTKGHFHRKEGSAELYIGLQGRGYLILQTKEGQFSSTEIEPGIVIYVPPYWGHRVVNTSQEKLIIFAIYASDAGHDYELVEKKGFMNLVFQENDRPKFIKNPKYFL